MEGTNNPPLNTCRKLAAWPHTFYSFVNLFKVPRADVVLHFFILSIDWVFPSFFYSATSIPSGTSSLMVSISITFTKFLTLWGIFPLTYAGENFVDSRWSLWFPRFHCCLVCVWTDGPQFWGTAVLACCVKWHPSFVCFIVIFLLELALSFSPSLCWFCCCCCWEWGWKRELLGWEGEKSSHTCSFIFLWYLESFKSTSVRYMEDACSIHIKA